MLCSECLAVKHANGFKSASILRCRSWGCELCQPMRFRDLRGQAARGNPDMFLTITWRIRDGVTPAEAAAALANAWRNAVKRLERKWHRSHIEYFAVFERTKQGWPHLHILARAKFIPQKWLSRTMNELCGSPIVDVRRIHGQRQAVNYVTKYVGKNPFKFGTCKRYWFTRGYRDAKDAAKTKPLGCWAMIDFSTKSLAHWKWGYIRNGWEVSDETQHSCDIYFPCEVRSP